MNILFIASNVTLCGRSGDAVHVREIVEELAKLGNTVFVITRDLQGVPREDYDKYQATLKDIKENENIKIYFMRSKLKLSFWLNRDYETIKHCLRILNTRKIDMIYSRSFNAYIEGFMRGLFQVPLVLEINGMAFEESATHARKQTKLLYDLHKASSRIFFRKATSIITVTNKLKHQLIEGYQVETGKITVVSNGVNVNLFKPTEQDFELKNRLGIDKIRKVVCFVGSFDPWHGLQGLPEAAKKVVAREKNVMFLLVGDGIMRPIIEKAVKKEGLSSNFLFTGSVPYEEVHKYINASDICITPFPKAKTHSPESSALKFFEYLACGKPVVATDVKGVADIVKLSGGGLLVRADDPDDLGRGIVELLGDRKRQKIMGRKGRKYVMEHCTWKQSAEKVFRVMKNVSQK